MVLHGHWPDNEIDHINGDKTDNRACNLRLATHAQNMRNRPMKPGNKSGAKGVSWHKTNRKWVAQIQVNRRKKTIGYYITIEDAAAAYARESEAMHGEFGRVD